MRNVLTIAGKELRSYFISPMAYAVMFLYFGVCGLLFCAYTSSAGADADMRPLFHTMLFMSVLVSPFVTMGLIAIERATGTMELLMTKPVRDVEVVLGKYLAAVALLAIMLLISLEFPLAMAKFGHLDWAATLGGYLGLLFCGIAFLSIGVFASSITDNQIAAVAVAAALLLFFWLIGFLAPPASSVLSDVMKHMSLLENFQDFDKGIIDTKSILYYFSLAGFMIFLAVRALENRRTV